MSCNQHQEQGLFNSTNCDLALNRLSIGEWYLDFWWLYYSICIYSFVVAQLQNT